MESTFKLSVLNGINNNAFFSMSPAIIQLQETMNSMSKIYGSQMFDIIKTVQTTTHNYDFQMKNILVPLSLTLKNNNSAMIKAIDMVSMMTPTAQFYMNSGISGIMKTLNTQLQSLNYSDVIKKMLVQNNIGSIIQNCISINDTIDFDKLNYRDFQTEVKDIKRMNIQAPTTTVESLNAQLTIDDIENVVSKCLNESGINSELMNITDVINNLIKYVKKLDVPLYKNILVGIIGSILATMIIFGFQNVKTTLNPKNTTNAIRTINKNVASLQIDKSLLKGYRFATIETLTVWEGSNTKSRKIGNLHLGQVVRIKYKNKNWTLIEYKDDGDEISDGWVFTRYISNFKY